MMKSMNDKFENVMSKKHKKLFGEDDKADVKPRPNIGFLEEEHHSTIKINIPKSPISSKNRTPPKGSFAQFANFASNQSRPGEVIEKIMIAPLADAQDHKDLNQNHSAVFEILPVEEDDDKKIRFKFDKQYTEANLISDIVTQKHELEEFFAYLVVFQDISRVRQINPRLLRL
jgi:hypothetical protein